MTELVTASHLLLVMGYFLSRPHDESGQAFDFCIYRPLSRFANAYFHQGFQARRAFKPPPQRPSRDGHNGE